MPKLQILSYANVCDLGYVGNELTYKNNFAQRSYTEVEFIMFEEISTIYWMKLNLFHKQTSSTFKTKLKKYQCSSPNREYIQKSQ